MGKDFTATITNPKRAEEWEALLGITTVYIKSPIPKRANLPGHPNALIYELDMDLITNEQRRLLEQHFHLKFGVPEEMVLETLEEIGVPILADDCIVSVANPLRWF